MSGLRGAQEGGSDLGALGCCEPMKSGGGRGIGGLRERRGRKAAALELQGLGSEWEVGPAPPDPHSLYLGPLDQGCV